MNSSPKSTPLRRIAIRACAGVILFLVCASALFIFVIYPFHGLKGLGRAQYEAAIMKAAKDFAASESLVPSSLVRSRFEALDEDGDACAWGSVSLHTPEGDQVHLWVSLEWFALWHGWSRDSIFIMADPRDRIFFAERLTTLGSFKKTHYAIQNARREALRRIRDVWLDLNSS